MATNEDFSFPATTNTPPRFIESPRLWRTTSLVSSPKREDLEDSNFFYYASKKSNNHSMNQRKSFSHIECGMKTTCEDPKYGSDGDDEDQKKMDMLWEDFNEEFSRNSEPFSITDPDHHHHHHPGKLLNFGCVGALKLPRPNKKPSIVEFVKVLKKMFLLQNSHRSMKKTQW